MDDHHEPIVKTFVIENAKKKIYPGSCPPSIQKERKT